MGQRESDIIQRLLDERVGMEHDLNEANAELRRHHEDFLRIRLALDSTDSPNATVAEIRRVVG